MLTVTQAQEISRLAGLWATGRVRKALVAHGCGAPGESPESARLRERKANAEFHDYVRGITYQPHPGDAKTPSDEVLVELAREEHQRCGEIEVDDDAVVCRGCDPITGAYVQAWVWVDLPKKEDV